MTPERFEVRSPDGTLIPVYRSGDGRPLVLVHGFGPDHSSWDRVRPHLEPRATVLAIDRRNRFTDPSIRYDLRREFEDVAAVAAGIDGEVDLVGQSSGAICALGASLLISNLRRLVLYEPPLVGQLESTLEKTERLFEAGDLEGAADVALRESLRLSSNAIAARKAAPDWSEYVARVPFRIREEAVVRAWEPDAEAFRSLRAPTLYLVGANTPAGHHHRGYIDLLKSAGVSLTVVEIPGQEHFAHREAPEIFGGILLDFLEAA